MVEVMQKYKTIFIILSLILCVIIAWFVLTKENVDKVPSRGVFVLDSQDGVGEALSQHCSIA